MAAPFKYFLDGTSEALDVRRADRQTRRGIHVHRQYPWRPGNHAALMMLPLLHHGMLLTGLPYSESDLIGTQTGGTPYGPSHLAGPDGNKAVERGRATACTGLGPPPHPACGSPVLMNPYQLSDTRRRGARAGAADPRLGGPGLAVVPALRRFASRLFAVPLLLPLSGYAAKSSPWPLS